MPYSITYAPEQYQALENLVREKWFKYNPEQMQHEIARKISAYEKATKGKQVLSEADALEEIIADATHEFINDRNFAKTVSEEDPSLGKAVLNAIREMLRRLRQVFTSGKYEDSDTYMNSFFSQIGILEEAERLWLDAYKAAVRNKAAVGMVQWDEDARKRHAIVEGVVDDEGNTYDQLVQLETDVFKDVPKSEWIDKVDEWIEEHQGMQMVMYDAGVASKVRLANKSDKFYRKGNSSKTRALNKLKNVYGEVKQMAVVNISDLVKISKRNGEVDTTNLDHGWLDKYGWEHRITFFVTPQGAIYSALIDIAHSANGKIAYNLKEINEIGRVQSVSNGGITQSPISKMSLPSSAEESKYSLGYVSVK